LNDSQTITTSKKETLLKLYKVTVLHVLLYNCENWTLLKQHERRTEAAEMVSVVGYTWYDHKTNSRIRQDISTYNLI
jgi:hypothetical protein